MIKLQHIKKMTLILGKMCGFKMNSKTVGKRCCCKKLTQPRSFLVKNNDGSVYRRNKIYLKKLLKTP